MSSSSNLLLRLVLKAKSKVMEELQLTIVDYIEDQDESIRPQLQMVYDTIKAVLPYATEKFSYGMPTFWKGRNLIHFAAQKKHLGLYPGADAITYFEEHLQDIGLKYSKGAIQIPYEGDLPLELIRSITVWCLEHYAK